MGFATGVVLAFLDAATGRPGGSEPLEDLVFVVSFAAFPAIGYLLATRRPENSIGWLMLGMGVFGRRRDGQFARLVPAPHRSPRRRPRAPGSISPSWVPIVVLPVTFLLLLFPDGTSSPRWRWFAWVVGVGLTTVYFAILLDPGPLESPPAPGEPNPSGSTRSGRSSTSRRR